MKPILNLNKHPKDCDNLSLVYANNVKLSNDLSCLQSENELKINTIIQNYLTNYYKEEYKIISLIPCNTELLIICKKLNSVNTCDIFRYNERNNQIKINYSSLNYNNGEIKGDFTYNVNDELILAITEYNGDIDVPLRTINLGKFEENKEQLSNELLSINPEVFIPTLLNYDYVEGNLLKGWYYIFIRYKIDNNDYTQWFDIGGPILLSNIEKQSIFKLYGYKVTDVEKEGIFEPFSTGILDHFNSDKEYSNESLKLNLKYLDNRYKKYQISFVCVNKTNIKSFKTFDIDININDYIFNISAMEECDYLEIITNNYNFYNVKSLINYQNRLYISNYKERNLEDYDTSNIILNLKNINKEYSDLKYIQYLNSSNTEETYLNVDEELDYYENKFENDSAKNNIIINLNINGKLYNTLFEAKENVIDLSGGSYGNFNIHFLDENYKLKPQIIETINDNISTYTIRDLCKIITTNGNILNIEFYAQIKNYTLYGDCYFKYTINNKSYITKCKYVSFDYSYLTLNLQIDTYNAKITDDILIPEDIINENNKSIYLNTKNSFNERKKSTSLIPGEIYNFYIHFVDKYGYSTKGFKLKSQSSLEGYVPVLVNYVSDLEGVEPIKYALMKPNTNIFNEAGNIQIENCVATLNYFEYLEYEKRFVIPKSCFIDAEGLKNKLIELYGSLSKNLQIKWEDVSVGNIDTYIFKTQEEYIDFASNKNNYSIIKFPVYLNYYNKDNNVLFKIPYNNIETLLVNNDYIYNFNNIEFTVKNVEIPDNYIGYFISYEKFEKVSKCTGILTKYDFNDTEHLNNNSLNNYNNGKNSKMYFYSSDFDILDSMNLEYNTLRIENKNTIKASKNYDIVINSVIQNISNLNVPELLSEENFDTRYYNISDYNVVIGGDTIKNRFGLGTALEIPIIEDLFPEGEINLYKVSLLYINNNNYTNEDKTLIKCTNIIYPDRNKEEYPIQYLNGKNTYNGILIYDNNKFIFNPSDLKIYAEKNKQYVDYGDLEKISNGNMAKFLAYIQIPCYQTFFYETKSFKNKPKIITFKLDEVSADKENINIEIGCIVEPNNSIDLFENKYTDIESLNPKIYQNNRTDIKYLTQFDKFVRRSDVIQDESLSNAWRRFGLENYKVISENKGKITNLVGIGTYLLIHTEHSLFAFNNDNTLQTLDKNIQLAVPDIFDLDYRELITSDLGYAGLQDSNAVIVDQFGYVFYDNDSNRLFRFDENKLDYIDLDIVQFLQKYKPHNVIFAHDKKSNRILIKLNFTDITKENTKVLSYNYLINKFISFHDYNFDKGINTKNQLYLLDINKTNLYQFDYFNIQNISYQNPCQLDIIINDNYNIIKQLEYIIYKLYKIKYNTDKDYINSPVEGMKLPYSGEQIRVYNNEVDTGWLDIKIDTEESKNVFSNYDKPYWDLGNWNFNYLRNKLSNKLGLDFMSKLYGNYFIVSIIFGDSNERIEFESLGYNITKDKRI